jgi:hypothetical protein
LERRQKCRPFNFRLTEEPESGTRIRESECGDLSGSQERCSRSGCVALGVSVTSTSFTSSAHRARGKRSHPKIISLASEGTTPETIQRFYKTADETDVPLGEWLKRLLDTHDVVKDLQKLADERKTPLEVLVKQALDALERAGAAHTSNTTRPFQ